MGPKAARTPARWGVPFASGSRARGAADIPGVVLGLALALWQPACKAGNEEAATPSAKTAPTQTESKAAPGGPIHWSERVDWVPWEQALAEAGSSGKPICLVVYADWCGRCRELAPLFDDPELVALSKRMLMVRQNSDERPPWLQQRFGQLGSYVPRVLLLDSKGELQPQLVSGHPRYPYFYARMIGDKLLDNMRALLGAG